MLSDMLTSVDGASAVFCAGVTAYTPEAKERILGLRKEVIERYSAVSPRAARSMAQGVLRLCGAHASIATTGYAGSGLGAAAEKRDERAGLVYIALSFSVADTIVKRFLFNGSREQIKKKACSSALSWLRKELIRRYPQAE